ncbi:MAG: protein kinase [Planctomycetota bacterium]
MNDQTALPSETEPTGEGTSQPENFAGDADGGADLEFARQLEEFHRSVRGESQQKTETADTAMPRSAEKRDRLRRAQECVRLLDHAAAVDADMSGSESARDGKASLRPQDWNEFAGTDRFVIRRWLGAGGMGTVFEAFDRERKESVALKTMSRVDAAALYYFKREFRSLADVHHQNLVKLHELFSVNDQWFFTMELLDGMDILSASREAEQPDHGPARSRLEKVRDYFQQLASGLVALHETGKLHRDIKPSNVLVTSTDRVVLLDFGLTKEFDRSAQDSSTEVRIVGTIAYMSPEQAAGRTLSPASDWYSVGVMLYESLTGCPPRFLNTEMQAITPEDPRILGDRPFPPERDSATSELRELLSQLCMDLLSLRPENRPSGREVLRRMGTIHPQERSETTEAVPVHFVGRSQQLQTLRDIYRQVQAGGAALVEIHGPSGIGKSALVQRFLEEVQQHRTVVLAGKCYEREYVPYKALDSIIDALSHFLRRRKRLEAETFLPRDVTSLVKLFPVLRRVDAIVAAPKTVLEIPDPQEVRRRAIASLRELLARIADRMPLILWIDDLQWGDIDSAVVLTELLRPPQPPPLLLIASYRREDASTSPCVVEMRKALATAGVELARHEIAVDALEVAEAGLLAKMLLSQEPGKPTADTPLDDLAESIARESGGDPFFVGELVRHQHAVRARGQSEAATVDLETVLLARIHDLPKSIRRLLEVVSVAGRPLNAIEACLAADLEEQPTSIELLKESRLVRSLPSVLRPEIEVWHDRIREAVVREISSEVWQQHHFRLAVVLEQTKSGDLERLAMHFKEAQLFERACEYYALAADRAARSLAFERAAQFYRHAIESAAPDQPQRRLWQTHLGDALANAGRGADAAQVYLQAADGAPPDQSLDLTRRAGFQYCITGHLDEGRAAFRDVLEKIGMSYPHSRWRTLLLLIYYRTKLRLRGLMFQRRRPELISENERLKMAITESVAMGASTNNPWHGALFQTRHLLQALDSGDPVSVGIAIAWEAGYTSMEGGANWPRTAALLQRAKSLAEETQDAHAAGSSALAFGIAEFLSGRYLNAIDHNLRAEQIFRERCTGITWEQDTAQVFGLWSWFYMGRIAELRSRYQTVAQEARERGDRYLMTTLGTQVGTFLHLVNNDPIVARETLEELMSRWTNDGFTVQHHNALFARIMIDRYEGQLEPAMQRLAQTEFRYRTSLLTNVQHIRVDLAFLKARLFLETASRERGDRAAWLRKATRCARDLRSERMPYASALASYVEANVVHLQELNSNTRNSHRADLLNHAMTELGQLDLRLLAKAAEWQLGLWLGDAGDERVQCAQDWFAMQTVANPERLLRAVSLTFLGVKPHVLAAGDKNPEGHGGDSIDQRGHSS